MQRALWFYLVVAAGLWICWCGLVVEKLVPMLHRHITFWPWLMAYVLCVAPVIALAIGFVVKARQES